MRRDPRLIAVGIAVGFMLLDDLPEYQYNTFHDPGAAAMLSIVFANAITSLVRRGWNPLWLVWLWVPLSLKFFVQPFFWVRDAWFYDMATLLVVHGIIGFLVFWPKNLRAGIRCSAVSVVALCLVLLLISLISLFSRVWLAFYWQLAAARVLIPIVFWTIVLSVQVRYAKLACDCIPIGKPCN